MTDLPTWEKKILPIVLPSMVEVENFSENPHTVSYVYIYNCNYFILSSHWCSEITDLLY